MIRALELAGCIFGAYFAAAVALGRMLRDLGDDRDRDRRR